MIQRVKVEHDGDDSNFTDTDKAIIESSEYCMDVGTNLQMLLNAAQQNGRIIEMSGHEVMPVDVEIIKGVIGFLHAHAKAICRIHGIEMKVVDISFKEESDD